jgi:hypothetical protein
LAKAPATQVIIVGAGPVGLTLAIDLGRRGVRCILLEQKEAPQFLPKMERCNARTMEIYRRLGIVEQVRGAGFPRDAPMDVFIVTSLIAPPLLHLPYPSVAQAQAEIAACNDGRMCATAANLFPSSRMPVACAHASKSVAAQRKSALSISLAAMAAPARCAASSGSNCRVKPILCSFARRFSAATICSSASRSAKGGIITSPTTKRRF